MEYPTGGYKEDDGQYKTRDYEKKEDYRPAVYQQDEYKKVEPIYRSEPGYKSEGYKSEPTYGHREVDYKPTYHHQRPSYESVDYKPKYTPSYKPEVYETEVKNLKYYIIWILINISIATVQTELSPRSRVQEGTSLRCRTSWI